MSRKQRPRVTLKPVASYYTSPSKRIIEFSAAGREGGGLIAIRWVDAHLYVKVYRIDTNVTVIAPRKRTRRGKS